MKKIIILGVLLLCTRVNAQNLDWVKTIGYSQIVWSGDLPITSAIQDLNGSTYSVSYGSSASNFAFSGSPINPPYSMVSGVIIKSNSLGVQNWVKFLTPEYISGNSGAFCNPNKIFYKDGFIYVAGTLSGSIDMDPNGGIVSLYGSSSCFLAKYDTIGNYVWSKGFGGLASKVFDITVDNSGNVYATGNFQSNFSFNNISQVNQGSTDIFLVKFSSNGNELWCNTFGTNATHNEQGNTLAIDQNNNVIVGGVFGNSIDFNPGSGVNTLTSNGNRDGFLIKYDQIGNYIQGISIGGIDADMINNISISGNNLIVTGRICAGPIDMDGGTGIQNLTGHPNGTGFILKMNPNFDYQWAKAINHPNPSGGSSGDLVKVIGNNIYISGSFAGTADLDFDSNNDFLVTTSSQGSNTFILKTDLNGSFIWGGALLNVGNVWEMNNYGYTNYPLGISISNGGLYLCGAFKGQVDFEPDTQASQNVWSSVTPSGLGVLSGFLLKLDNCNVINTTEVVASCDQYIWNNQTYQTSGTYVQNFQTVDGCDSTVTLNLTIYTPTSSSFSETSCEPFTWNGNTYASSGQYSQTLIGSNGCDSIVTLNLTILNGPTAQVTQDGLLLTANTVSGATYQWIYCSDLTPVPNQTFSQFAPQANGTYAVVITDNCGSDTSDCITISTIGIDELKSVFQVYPNPVNSELNVEIDLTVSEAIYSILDLNYRIIQTGKILHSQPINVRSLADGTYILKIESLGYVRFIKQ
jgi:hypothetical protein